ncbi:MAG: TonB-dependent receptor, partial [Chryseobacterium sp.]|nr:TonB-dependent receptor [Candidatus Chryseobacterium enterohippi]
TIYAQVVNGVVVDSDFKKPLPGVLVRIENSGIWTVTNQSGEFQIKYIQGGTLEFKRSGLLEEKKTYLTLPNSTVRIELQRASVRIKEISLTAKKKRYSEIEIKEEALKSIQAFSLNEVLEQIPGQKIQNLNLNEFKPIVFRSTQPTRVSNDGFGNKSFGTSIVVDGIPMSNNENMQSYAGNYAALGSAFGDGSLFSPNTIGFGSSSTGDFNGYFSNTNYGADLRDIPVDNIESVEVVQGIPSARYGDLTSGLVNIQQKSGETPYRAYVALREGTKEVNFNKGFKLSDRLGYLNTNVNYLNSNSDPRTQFNVFERFASSLMWTFYNKSKTLSNSITVEYSNSLDNLNSDAEDLEETMINNKTRNIKISNRFNWRFKNSIIDNLSINANYTNGYQNTKDSKLINSGGSIVGTSTQEGIYEGVYSPVNYRQSKEIEGKPISMFFSADIKKRVKTQSNWIHNMLAGTSARSSDNKGEGRIGNPETLQNQFAGTGVGFRPYNFGQNVRAEYQFSLYVEDNINKAFGSNILNINAGLRYDNQFGSNVFQPRINAYLIHNSFKIRGGFGISSKAPSINMIYTGPRYYDVVLADLRLPGYYNLGIMQTYIDQSDNKDLKPSKSARSEVGVDYKFPFGNIGLTAYYNKLYDGFTTQDYAVKRNLAVLDVQYNGNNTPTYGVSGYKDYFYTQYKNVNALESTDKGLELMASFWKLPIKNVSLDINGSYIETTNNSSKDKLHRSTVASADQVYGVYRWFDTNYKQFNLGAVLNYHLPKAGLVVSLRTQHFLIDSKQYDNARIPYAYLDTNLNKIELTQDQMNDPKQFANIKYPNLDEVDEKLQKVYHNFNLRISKDFLNGFKFSFYANNFVDLKQTYMVME